MEWGDVLTIFLILAGVWYMLVPGFVRRTAAAGIGPAVHAAAEQVRGMVRAVAPAVRWLAYDVLLGVKRSGHDGAVVLSSSTDHERPMRPGFAADFETETRAEIPREIQRNSPETPSSDFIDAALVKTLATLVHRGELGKTAAIKIGLQRESGARYQAGKAALDAALARMNGTTAADEREHRLRTVAREAVSRR